jgi:hypothetical protein
MARSKTTNADGRRILERIRNIQPFIQASLTITKKRCGKPSCRCAREGPIHESALLTWKEGGKTHTLYVPASYRKQVAQWVDEGKRLKRLIAQMSKAQRRFLLQEKKSKKNKRR